MEERDKQALDQAYASTLREATEVFESCGCMVDVTSSIPSQAVLTITGPISFCPASIFEEHLEKARELMHAAHPDVDFRIEVMKTDELSS